MKVSYLVEITDPHLHLVKVSVKGEKDNNSNEVELFLPSWSPGSYLMREYSRHIRWSRACQGNGEVIWSDQIQKGTWKLDWKKSQLNKPSNTFEFQYEIYLHELTVRTSHVDDSHAFLHGPSYLMSVVGGEKSPTIQFRFPPAWAKISTTLDVVDGDKLIYSAKGYDELIDSVVEIGCHETDGFMVKDIPHHLAFYGEVYPHSNNLKEDMQKVVTHVADLMGDIPFEKYLILTHFVPKLYGGLEHLDSTALHYDGRKLNNRKDYLNYLSLVAHEYFHAWNVKRIRPKELGPFDYRNEGYTRMLWLAEGLTSFMDDLFVYQAGLSTLEEYLGVVKTNLDNFFSVSGKKFHSLEDSSFNAWIKLYRPDENSKNSSVSYYLKGGLAFMCLNALLVEKNKTMKDLILLLWKDYKGRPYEGVTKEQVYQMIHALAGEGTVHRFQSMVETTEDLNFEEAFNTMGLELVWNEANTLWVGADWDFDGNRVLVKSVALDSPAAKFGLNAGDELIFLNELRVLKEDVDLWPKTLKVNTGYQLTVSRLGKLVQLQLVADYAPRSLKEIRVKDLTKVEKTLKF